MQSIVDDDGNFDLFLFWQSQREEDEEDDRAFDEQFEELRRLCEKRKTEEEKSSTHKKRIRSCKKIVFHALDDAGNRVPAAPTQTCWYMLYILHSCLASPKFHTRFRGRFRLPYDSFQQAIAEAKESGEFVRWCTKSDAVGVACSPIELLVLGSLRYLGRGWTFDCLEEQTLIAKETHRQFFHEFISYGSTESRYSMVDT
jgi:hypothetical protein